MDRNLLQLSDLADEFFALCALMFLLFSLALKSLRDLLIYLVAHAFLFLFHLLNLNCGILTLLLYLVD